jgi:signal transduction histidine kinase
MFLKKRAFRYFNKSLKIATSIHRKDLISFAKCFGGITYYYDAKWKDAEKYLVQSISDYKSVGDVWGQLTPLEHLGYLAFNNGIFEKCITKMQEEGTLSKECNDIRGTILSKRMIALVQLLEGKNKESDWEELKKTVSQMKDSLINTMANISLSTKALLTEKIIESFEISKKSLETIKEKNLNQEYIASAFSTHCEILIAEKRNRIADESKKQLDLSDKRLLNQLKSHSHKAFLRGIVYPAHLGAAFRSLAWSFYFKGHERLATFFFVQAIKKHHVLDMRYEEAKSRRDYGLFLEACNFSGEARDQFNAAYRLFHACGAILETERLKDKVDIIPFEPKTIEARKIESSETSTFEVSQFRIDTLYEVSSSMREIDDLDTLLKQMLAAMIKATGAQYGCVFLEGNKENDYVNKSMAMNFDGTMLNLKEVYCSEKIIADTKKQKKIILVKNSLETGLNRDDTERVRSVLCVPLCHGESYQGCVYLANNIVSSLFSETSKKAVQILSAQADILLQNAYLMAEFKKLNRNLEKKVREQTNDIQEKNKQLAEYNVKVVESERMKGLLTGTLVHDIKNSVSGIEGNAELLNRSFPNEPKVKKMVTIVADCCASIVSLASNLLDIGKMEEGKLLIKKEQLGVKNIFAIADHLKKNAMFEEKCVIVSLVDNTNDTFVIDADYYLVDRVLQNLLSNAVKYVPRNGNVTLSLETFGEENIICCYNSGAPIQDEYKNVLFDKYARVDSKASQYSKGLGLFFSKMVMNAHNGRIWLDTDKTGNYFKLSFKKRNINFLNSTSPAA